MSFNNSSGWIGGYHASQSRPVEAGLAPTELDNGTMQCSRAESSAEQQREKRKTPLMLVPSDAEANHVSNRQCHPQFSNTSNCRQPSHSRSQAADCAASPGPSLPFGAQSAHNRSSEPLPLQGPFLSPGSHFRGVKMHGLAVGHWNLSQNSIRASEKLVRGTTGDCLCVSVPP